MNTVLIISLVVYVLGYIAAYYWSKNKGFSTRDSAIISLASILLVALYAIWWVNDKYFHHN